MIIYHIILSENGVIKKAIFGLSAKECLDRLKEIRQNPLYSEMDLRVERVKEPKEL